MENIKSKLGISILICSHDGAKDLWSPLEKSYKKYWPDCPFKIFLLTNYNSPKSDFFKTIKIGKEVNWSDKIILAMKKINTEYILLTYDDLFFKKRVSTKKLLNLSKLVVDNDWSYLSFIPHIKISNKVSDDLSILEKNRQYRNSSPWSIYKKNVLNKLLLPGESAWEFEKIGSVRSNIYENFYSINYDFFDWHNAIVKGKWKPDILKSLINEGIVEKTSIPSLSKTENFFKEVHMFYFYFLRKILPIRLAYYLSRFKNYFF